jgi:hypothetical protein
LSVPDRHGHCRSLDHWRGLGSIFLSSGWHHEITQVKVLLEVAVPATGPLDMLRG